MTKKFQWIVLGYFTEIGIGMAQSSSAEAETVEFAMTEETWGIIIFVLLIVAVVAGTTINNKKKQKEEPEG
jgi:hypothetical protein